VPYCVMFDHSCVINPGGAVRPCCHYEQEETWKYYEDGWYEKHQELGKLMASTDTYIDECRECQSRIDRGQQPFNELYNSKFSNSQGIVHWDLKLNNTCNLTCKMCDSWNSSSWEGLLNKNPQISDSLREIYQQNISQRWHKDISSIFPYLFFAKQLKFTGGEPFMIPQVWKIIDYVIQEDISPALTLSFTTNGTFDMLDKWDLYKHFKHVTFNISVDAVGERYEYIRQGSSWSNVEKNIKAIAKKSKGTNVTLNLDTVRMCLNKDNLNEITDFANSIGIQHKVDVDCVDPDIYSPNALENQTLKTKLVSTLKELDKIHGTDYRKFINA